MKRYFITLCVLSIVVMMISGCSSSDESDIKTTGIPQVTGDISVTVTATPTEEPVTETPITETPTTADPVTDSPISDKGDEDMPTGKWYDKNGDTVLEFKGNKMYVTWWSAMETPEEFDIAIEKNNDETYIYNAGSDYKSFGIMSQLQIRDDGTLRAYEEILDGESHSYKFVPEDRIEEEKAVKDFSKDMPKEIQSTEIKSFSLYLDHYYIEGLGSGNYTWNVKKNEDGGYISEFEGMGPSYVIIQDRQEVDDSFVEGLMKLIEDNKVIENNGMFYSHDENDTEYSLYITYESRERVYIKVGSKALDKWPVDNGEFIAYAMSIINTEDNEQ